MVIKSERIIHSDEKRHKCHFCGAVKYESKMRKLKREETRISYHWANDEKCWACKNPCFIDFKFSEQV